jgi:N-glycosylase/DNA lyase
MTTESLLTTLDRLRSSRIRKTVDARLEEFRRVPGGGEKMIFSELCFCLLTANYSAEGGIRIQKDIGDGFMELPMEELAVRLRKLGHRFPDARAGYITGARPLSFRVMELVNSDIASAEARNWLAENVKGLGLKEASHFLRNVGFTDLAIIDFHIIDLMVRHGLIERPRTLTTKRYLETEQVLKRLGAMAGMNLAELDLYLWYMETGKILK